MNAQKNQYKSICASIIHKSMHTYNHTQQNQTNIRIGTQLMLQQAYIKLNKHTHRYTNSCIKLTFNPTCTYDQPYKPIQSYIQVYTYAHIHQQAYTCTHIYKL